jgi:hypothetical protein
MSLPSKTMLKRLLATALCLVALNIYVAFAPVPVGAGGECTCSTCNRCENGQRCICLYQGTKCHRRSMDRRR